MHRADRQRMLYRWRTLLRRSRPEVCRRWLDSFEHFLVDMPLPDGCPPVSLVRRNPRQPYEPGNCFWRLTGRRRRPTAPGGIGLQTVLTYRGRQATVEAWCAELDLWPDRVCARLRHGWTAERALEQPPYVKTPVSIHFTRPLQFTGRE